MLVSNNGCSRSGGAPLPIPCWRHPVQSTLRLLLSYRSATRLAFCLTAVTTFVGCGDTGPSTHPVTGTLTIGGQPTADVLVTFEPLDGSLMKASGRTSADGTYTLYSGTQGTPGAQAGSYKVTLQPQQSSDDSAYTSSGNTQPQLSDSNIPPEYASAETTPQTAEVTSGSNSIDIDVK
jgi:hypothetical protein